MLDRSANDALVSGTGLFACQLAKHVLRAGKVITTVSTAKIPKIKDLLGEGTIDEGKTVLSTLRSFYVLTSVKLSTTQNPTLEMLSNMEQSTSCSTQSVLPWCTCV